MPKVRKNKSKDNIVPFNKPKVDKVAEEKSELRQSEQDRLNAVIKKKCSEIESEYFSKCFDHPDFKKGVNAFLNKQKPNF